MTDYKELIEQLRDCLKHDGRPGIVNMPADYVMKAADAIEELWTANRWIPVEEKEPNMGEVCLFSQGKSVWLGFYMLGGLDGVSAWRPIPKPYK